VYFSAVLKSLAAQIFTVQHPSKINAAGSPYLYLYNGTVRVEHTVSQPKSHYSSLNSSKHGNGMTV
jgi:hypothetical protein